MSTELKPLAAIQQDLGRRILRTFTTLEKMRKNDVTIEWLQLKLDLLDEN